MFAAITPALITGAFAERKRFGAFVLFTLLWSILVYSPIAHWVWAADGWLFKLGALDFAGGTVVHISSGVSALVVALLIGRRVVNGERHRAPRHPDDRPRRGLLWFGWFGFNAGSALAANGLAANALLVTNTAAAAATITWVLASYIHKRKVRVVGAACGAVAGLVAITPASGFVTAGGALVIGLARRRDLLRRDPAPRAAPRRRRARRLRRPRRRRHVRRHRDRRLRDHGHQRLLRPDRRQPAAGRHPARRRRRDDRLRRRRDVHHRQGRRRRSSGSASRPPTRRWASTCPSTARSPTRPDPSLGHTRRSSGRRPGALEPRGCHQRQARGSALSVTEPQPSRTPIGRSSAARAAAHATPPAARALGSHHGPAPGPSTPKRSGRTPN